MSKLTLTATGDSLFVNKLPKEYEKESKEIKDFISSCDVKITNLETNLSDFDLSPNAYSGGTWLNTRKKYLQYLIDMGFNYFGTANNHCMDYGHEGLMSTVKTLDEYKLEHSGTGETLAEAEKPAVLNINGKKISIFAVDTSFETGSKAGYKSKYLKGRPGVNYLGHNTCYTVSEEELKNLKEIAQNTHINFTRDFNIQTGFLLPDKEDEFTFGNTKFTTKKCPATTCNEKDKERIIEDIKKAKETSDYVFLLVHCHDNDGTSVKNPPEYLKEFCKASIDAGVNAVFGGGCHELRGLEIYKNCPIFYSLGDFFYQGLVVEYLPSDFMLKYGIDIDSTATDALYARSRGGKVGLHLMEENYLTVLPKLTFEDGALTSLIMMPLYLSFDKKGEMNGLPVYDKSKCEEIFNILSKISKQYKTELLLKDGMINCSL